MKLKTIGVGVLSIGMAIIVAQQAHALAILLGDADNGGVVLEEKCTGCHINMFGEDGSSVYTREDRMVKTVEGLMQMVEACNVRTQNGELSEEILDDLTAHLNETFYRYDD